MQNNRGVLIVISGPSGAGKGTICKELLDKHNNIYISVSATTRSPRAGEVDGINYYFLTKNLLKKRYLKMGSWNMLMYMGTFMVLQKLTWKKCLKKEKMLYWKLIFKEHYK